MKSFKTLQIIINIACLLLMAFGIQFLFNIDWKWFLVVFFVIDQLKPLANDDVEEYVEKEDS